MSWLMIMKMRSQKKEAKDIALSCNDTLSPEKNVNAFTKWENSVYF